MSRFGPDDRAIIGALADVLIPEAEGMPAATAVGVAAALLDRVADLRADLVADLLRVVRKGRGEEPGAFLARLKAEDSEGFAALALVVAGGYYLSPEVRERLGYSGPERRPVNPGDIPDFEDLRLLDPVKSRGPIWRVASLPPVKS
jgi:hypothetical protein